MRFRASLACVLVLAACESSVVEPTSQAPSSTTTTTIENDSCERVTADTVRYLNDVIAELDDTRLREFADREAWPEELTELERAGRDLDIRVRALRCDPAEIQRVAFAEADLDPEGPLSERLLELLLAPDEPEPATTSTTSQAPAATTTTTAPATTSSTEGGESETTSNSSQTTSTTEPQG